MNDIRAQKFAQILVDHSTNIQPGERVVIYSSPAAEPVIKALFKLILERGAYPHVLMNIPNYEELMLAHASNELLEYVPVFHKIAFEESDVLLKVKAETNTRALSRVAPERVAHYQASVAQLIATQMRRGAVNSLRWMSTIYPTAAYAQEAEMGVEEYQEFFFRACHADENTPDPVAHWEQIEKQQQKFIERIQGHDQVEVRGPNADLRLSIKDRVFKNASGKQNLPDGEIYTGPVEDSAEGWVRYSYPAVHNGRVVEGVELTFEKGRVEKATAQKNQEYLLAMLNTDPGARYLGEFAIGTNFEIDRFTGSILLDEKIGGSFHTAVGAGYPETGNHNKSRIHWDMICDLRTDSEISLDGEVIYRNGEFVF